MSAAYWSTTVTVRQYDPATGLVLKVTVEREIAGDAVPPIEGQHPTVEAKYAALQAFRALDLDALITPESIEGTDTETRLHVSADPSYTPKKVHL